MTCSALLTPGIYNAHTDPSYRENNFYATDLTGHGKSQSIIIEGNMVKERTIKESDVPAKMKYNALQG